MTEMEKLKEETQKQYVKQRMSAVGEYIAQLADECHERFMWTLRCDLLELYTFVGYWVILATALFMDTPETVQSVALDLAFMVMLVAIFRGWWHSRAWREKEGEWKGAITVLEKLGMMQEEPPRGEKRKDKKPHPFAGLVELWSKLKQKAQAKVYQPV